MAKSFQKMAPSNSPYTKKVMCLTEDTSKAFSLTLYGIVDLIRKLLMDCIDYVLQAFFKVRESKLNLVFTCN